MDGLGTLLNVHDHHSVQYGSLFLVASGCYSAMPLLVCWFSMNLGGHRRRCVGQHGKLDLETSVGSFPPTPSSLNTLLAA
ncbi:hypothetical protein KXX16_005483, partial [Aspergillus fumigatus]